MTFFIILFKFNAEREIFIEVKMKKSIKDLDVSGKRVLLRPEEKRSLDRFMASPAVQNYTSSENRRVIIENEAAMELLAVRQKSAELIAQGKDPLPESEYRLHLSKDGVVIKALELPGLWNGSMSDWNTIFVEVPIETFNPVKTVNDLLRTQHQ